MAYVNVLMAYVNLLLERLVDGGIFTFNETEASV